MVTHTVFARSLSSPQEVAQQRTTEVRSAAKPSLLTRLFRGWGRSPASTYTAGLQENAQLSERLGEAARIWTAHLGTAQGQIREAIDQMLQGFAQILEQLDGITETDRRNAKVVADPEALDRRAAVLEECEAKLRGLLDNFHGFVRSREEIMASVRTLAESSKSLRGMAEDVATLARQTNMLSLNATIEAARAGQSGRGFAVVAAEVRRLSSVSGDTGKRIGEHVDAFSERMHAALIHADEHHKRDAGVIEASEQTINEVVGQVDAAVSDLNARASELSRRSAAVRAQVEQLMVAFQFQDRVHQIMDQLNASISSGMACLQQSLAEGRVPDAQEWLALLNANYTTDEQRAIGAGVSASTPRASTPTDFF